MLGSQLNVTIQNAQQVLAILGDLNAAVVAAGTSQSGATLLSASSSIVTTGTGGVRLPAMPTVSSKDRLHVANHLAVMLACYPPSGGKLSNQATNAPAMLAPGKCADFLCLDGTNYSALLGA